MTDTTENRLPTANTTEDDAMPVSAQIMAAADGNAEATTPRIDSGTISRFLVLLLALVNQGLTMFGHPVLNIDDTTITQLVSLAWTAGSAIWCYWKDNDVTAKARVKKARLPASRGLDKPDGRRGFSQTAVRHRNVMLRGLNRFMAEQFGDHEQVVCGGVGRGGEPVAQRVRGVSVRQQMTDVVPDIGLLHMADEPAREQSNPERP